MIEYKLRVVSGNYARSEFEVMKRNYKFCNFLSLETGCYLQIHYRKNKKLVRFLPILCSLYSYVVD